ncbi:MAG: hypothetical protein AAF543_21185 [Pseudomonadota bacterium]
MLRILPLLLSLCVTLAISAGRSDATEDIFIYVDRMPDIQGEHIRTIAGDDEEGGLRIEQDLYALDFEHAVIETYVLKAACAGGDQDVQPRTYIVAVKYPPKKPATFAVATLHDIYKEVYVEDERGKIRLYEDIQGQQMLTLSERFKPACLPT